MMNSYDPEPVSVAAAVTVILSILPHAFLGYTGSIERTFKIFQAPVVLADVLNSVIWVFFAFMVVKKDDCLELVLGYPMLLLSWFSYLMVYFGLRGRRWMVRKNLYFTCRGIFFFCPHVLTNSCLLYLQANILIGKVIASVLFTFYCIRFGTPLPETI